MTDFFARLVARHRGEVGALRPHVPFRFEPAGPPAGAASPTRQAAGPGWPPARTLRRPAGPGQPDELWRGPAAGDDHPSVLGLHPVRPAGLPRDQTADAGRDRVGTERANPLAVGRTGHAGRGPGPEVVAAARPETAAPAAPAAGPGAARRVPSPVAVLRPAAGPGPTGTAEAARPGAATPGPGALPERETALPAAGPGTVGLLAWRGRRSGPGHPDEAAEADAREGRDARRSRPPSPPVLRPEPPGHPGGQFAAATPARRRLADQPRARGQAAGPPSGPGQENITVQVTIGRVEVRTAPPAARAAAAPRRAAVPSLADYLRHRSRPAGAAP